MVDKRIKDAFPERMWVNQPSSDQTYHDWHGRRVLAIRDFRDMFRVYFLEGPIISMNMNFNALSPGWPKALDAPASIA